MKEFMQKGYYVFMGNFYISFGLLRKLIDFKTNYIGTLKKPFKWYINLWVNLVETSILNSYNLYSPSKTKLIFLSLSSVDSR